jgi:hypothetical protein
MTDATNGAEVEQTNPRNQAMAEIARNAHAEVEGDLQSFNEDTGEVIEAEKKEEVEERQEEAKEPPIEEETLIVDGKEIKVTKDKIIEAGKRTLQKESAADRRLQEATEMLRLAEERLRQTDSSSLPGEGVKKEVPTEIDVEQTIDAKLYQRDAVKAAQKFREEFPEIASNPMLMNWAAQLENQRIAEVTAQGGDLGDPFEAYRKHGNAVREQLKTISAPARLEDKQDRKRDTVAISGANARMPAPQPDKPKSTSQTIEDMRKARHQRVT